MATDNKPNSQLPHLIKMANQIAANLGAGAPGEEAAAQVASHLCRFWSPQMKQRICDYLDAGSPELSPLAADAVSRLKRQ